MNSDTQQHSGKGVSHGTALKARVAGALTTGVVVSLALAPEALAKLANNHNETVLVIGGALLVEEGR